MARRKAAVFMLVFMAALWLAGREGHPQTPVMEKQVTEQATFVLYLPRGWTAKESVQGNLQSVAVFDSEGSLRVVLTHGVGSGNQNPLALTAFFAHQLQKRFPDLDLTRTMVSNDGHRAAFDGVFTDARGQKREFRGWIGTSGPHFTYSRIEAPAGGLSEAKPLLLTILANIHLLKQGGGTDSGPLQVPLRPVRLPDGSASFLLPQGWSCQSLGSGCFLATDASGLRSFAVASVEALTPQLGVRVPNVLTLPYLPPAQALERMAVATGAASHFQFLEVNSRADLNALLRQVYTAGPAQAAELVYLCTIKGRRCQGYSFAVSFGSRLNTSWRLWHLTLIAPREEFQRWLPTFVQMGSSYRINDQYAQQYVAQGLARLRRMQQETSAMIARNARDIREMMQAAYNERQKSQDYIDYQRSRYIRGESDWISSLEGGTIYRADRWGSKNTATGEYFQGQPYNYFNFTGKHPKYDEQMQEIDSRALFEKYRGQLP